MMEEEEPRRAPTASPDEMHVMGSDKNIHQKLIQRVLEEVNLRSCFCCFS